MLRTGRTRLEVWGDPIAHSLSPRLHAAAYRVLGLEWNYGRRQVAEGDFDAEFAGLGAQWRGLSLTMPLKAAAFRAASVGDRRAELTGAANTLLLGEDGAQGFNTDVGGIVRALAEAGMTQIENARIVGAGATATSALVALGESGASRVEVAARRPEAAASLIALGKRIGVDVRVVALGEDRYRPVPVTVATLPGDAPVADDVADALAAEGGPLLDVVYGHWPTALAVAWRRNGLPTTSGAGMLLHQALLQVRIFVGGDPDLSLPDEATVLAAMRRALVGD